MMMGRREATLVLFFLLASMATTAAVPLHTQDAPEAASTESVEVDPPRLASTSAVPSTSSTPTAPSAVSGTSEAVGVVSASPAAATCVPDGQRHAACNEPESSESIPSLGTLASDVADESRDQMSKARPTAADDEGTSFLDRKDVQHASLMLGNISSVATIVVMVLAWYGRVGIAIRSRRVVNSR